MSEVNSNKLTTQYYVTGIRATPTGEKPVEEVNWAEVTANISKATASGAATSQADLEKLVEKYQYLYAAICDGTTVKESVQANANAFAQEFEKLFTSLGSGTVQNSPKAQFLMVLGNLIQEKVTGNLADFQAFVAAIDIANTDDRAGPAHFEQMMAMTLLLLAVNQLLQESAVAMQAAAFNNQMAALDEEITEDISAANNRKDSQDANASAQIAGGAAQVAGGMVAGHYASQAAGFEATHAVESAQAAQGGAVAEGAAVRADAAMTGLKVATANSESASALGQGTNTVVQGSASAAGSTMTLAADMDTAEGKEKSKRATGQSELAKIFERLADSAQQNSAAVLSNARDDTQGTLQSMSHVTV